MAQKPTNNTYLKNVIEHEVGLINTNIKIGDNMYPANAFTTNSINQQIDKIFLINKPNKQEKGQHNIHKTVKPLAICEYLIKLTALNKNAIIFDPFSGSGTTLVAAKILNKKYLGCDINSQYVEIANQRINQIKKI